MRSFTSIVDCILYTVYTVYPSFLIKNDTHFMIYFRYKCVFCYALNAQCLDSTINTSAWMSCFIIFSFYPNVHMNSEQWTANESTQNNHKFIYFFYSLHSLHKINSKRFTNLYMKIFETRKILYVHTCSLPSTRPFYITNWRKFEFRFVIVQFCSEKHSAQTRFSYMEIFKREKKHQTPIYVYAQKITASFINESQGQSR